MAEVANNNEITTQQYTGVRGQFQSVFEREDAPEMKIAFHLNKFSLLLSVFTC